MRVLLVEDDLLLARGLALALSREHFDVDHVGTGKQAIAALKSYDFDLCILDLTLPEVDGMVVIETIRAAGKATPILILSARDSVSDRIKGLNLGADDFVVKPFDIEELIARMRVLERRSSGACTNSISYKNLLLDLTAMTLRSDGVLVELQPNEFKLMRKLIENPSLILSRDQLEECLYGWGSGVESNTVSVYIHSIRKKMSPDVIRTVRGIGYRVG